MTNESPEIVVDFKGKRACFTRPECKVERFSYPVPTPSAIRGMLGAIYCKPIEFYWQVKKIEVLSPIQFHSTRLNEVKEKVSLSNDIEKMRNNPPLIIVDSTDNPMKGRTQRMTTYLLDPHYRVHAVIRKRESFSGNVKSLYEQAIRRIKRMEFFHLPYFGMAPFFADFKFGTDQICPIQQSEDFGLMLYDVYDYVHTTGDTPSKVNISLFHCKMENGIIELPDYDDSEVLKGVPNA